MVGEVVDGKYELRRLLGYGGMGNVYEAVHQGTGRRVAVKLIAQRAHVDDNGAVARFQQEAKAVGSVENPHVVQVFDAGTDRVTGVPFIAMELLEGCDLGKVVPPGEVLPPDTALRIVAQACLGLQKAHEAGIVHRDIKPANLFLARQSDGRVILKILDFGIAKLPERLLSPAQNVGAAPTSRTLGTPYFMSPEHLLGLRTLDHRTDIWSLGAVLFTTLAGRPPFSHCETPSQFRMAICSSPPPRVDLIASAVPSEVADIVECAMQTDPNRRYSTARAMHEAIAALLTEGSEIDPSLLVVEPEEGIPPTLGRDDIASVVPGAVQILSSRPSVDGKKGARPTPPASQIEVSGPGLEPTQRSKGSTQSGLERNRPRVSALLTGSAATTLAVLGLVAGSVWLRRPRTEPRSVTFVGTETRSQLSASEAEPTMQVGPVVQPTEPLSASVEPSEPPKLPFKKKAKARVGATMEPSTSDGHAPSAPASFPTAAPSSNSASAPSAPPMASVAPTREGSQAPVPPDPWRLRLPKGESR